MRTVPRPAMRASSPASMRFTIRWTTSRGVKCSPGFSSSASLNLRISSSKIVPIVGLSILLGCRSTVLKALQHLEQQPRLVELADGVVEVEPLQHLAHVAAEAGDVVAQVGCDVRRIGQQGFEVVARGVVEGESGSPAKLRVQVIQPASAQLGLPAQHLALGWCKHAIEPPEHGQRQDDVLVLAAA